MKKIFALLLTLTMLLPLASCRLKDTALPPPPTNANVEETTTAPTNADVEETTTAPTTDAEPDDNENVVPPTTDTPEDSNDLVNTSHPDAEKAMKLYELALKGEICVFDEQLGNIKLGDYRLPSDNSRLADCEILYKAVLDMNRDGINEYVIQSEAKDHIVLHYDQGKIYSRCFDNENFFNLNTDGSFFGVDSFETYYQYDYCTRECNQIVFEGSSIRVKEIYRIKQTSPYDYGDGSHDYFVDDKQIACEEFFDYYDSNCRGKTLAVFSPLDLSCEYPISSEKAFELASDYWGIQSGTRDGAAGTSYIITIVILEKPNNDTLSYRIGYHAEGYCTHVIDNLYGQPPSSEGRIYKELIVDAITGECRMAEEAQ